MADVPDLIVEDREGFIGSIADQIAFIVNFISIMLLLSIIIALIGVANTLSLSISERVRELGLLRAVGHEPDAAQAVDPLGGRDHGDARHRRSASSWRWSSAGR